MGVMIGGEWHEELADPGNGSYDNPQAYNQASGQTSWGQNLNTNYSPTAPGTPGTPGNVQGGGIDQILQALQKGDMRAFEEGVRQFNATHGLSVAGLTGTYEGAPTVPAMMGYATSFGQWGVPQQGQTTLAAQQQAYAQQLGAINAAAALQANPFRQQQVIGQLGGLLGGQGVAGFQAPNTVAGVGTAGGNTRGGMGYLQTLIDDIRDPTPNTTSMNQVLNAIPTPNKLNSVEFQHAAPSTQSMVLQGMQEKYGLDPNDALRQIQNTLPQFQAPTTMGSIKR